MVASVRTKLPALAVLVALSASCKCDADEGARSGDEDDPSLEAVDRPHERTTSGGDINAVADVRLLRDRLRGRLAGRVERVPGGIPDRPRGEHWPELSRFTASCGLLTVSAEESLTRAPVDLEAAVTAEETRAERETSIEAMPEARAPLRVVRVLSRNDVEVDGRFYAARLYVAFADASIVEVGLECDENAMSVPEWDALTKPFVASLVGGAIGPSFPAEARRSLRLGDAEVVVALPEGWGVVGRRDEDETAYTLTEVVELGRPATALTIVASSSCEEDADGSRLAEANGVEGPLVRIEGRLAGAPIQWFADRNERTLFHRAIRSPSSCLDWSIEAPDAAGVAAARRIAESATVR